MLQCLLRSDSNIGMNLQAPQHKISKQSVIIDI